jgi:hypothetical protein
MPFRPWFLSLALVSGCLVVATPAMLRDRQHAALERGDVLEAVRLGRARVKASPGSAAAHYDLACALARAGDGDEAVASLRTAIRLGFDAPGFLVKDEDLTSLHRHPAFPELVRLATEVGEQGIVLPGVRTEVRRELPMPLRIRLPATGRPRLAIWLHPFGARLNADIERLAPVFLAHGYALVVPVTMTSPGWGEEDLHALFDESVPALGDLVDTDRPLLIGFSAGSQAALAAWAREPSRFSAIIAGGCAPELHGAVLPAGGAPIYVLNGQDDLSTALWRDAIGKWQQEGRRVSLTIAPGLGHEFLFDEASLSLALDTVQ